MGLLSLPDTYEVRARECIDTLARKRAFLR